MSESWTTRYFDTVYLRRWSLGPPNDEVYRHVDFLLRQLSAVAGETLLDVGCGQGRYSLAFAGRGLRVTGLDSSAVLLCEARRLAVETDTQVNWIHGDMRDIPSTIVYDYAVLFDAFGFFDSDQENENVIRRITMVVGMQGRVVLAVANGLRILSAFEPCGREERDGRIVEVRRELDTVRRLVREEVTVEEHGRRDVAERRQRLYSNTELTDIVMHAGLTVCSRYGDLGGGPFDEATSEKIVLICKREHGSNHA